MVIPSRAEARTGCGAHDVPAQTRGRTWATPWPPARIAGGRHCTSLRCSTYRVATCRICQPFEYERSVMRRTNVALRMLRLLPASLVLVLTPAMVWAQSPPAEEQPLQQTPPPNQVADVEAPTPLDETKAQSKGFSGVLSGSTTAGREIGAGFVDIGARGSFFDISGSDRDGAGGGVGVAGHILADLGFGAMSARVEGMGQLGGSSAGLELQYTGGIAIGVRAPTRYVSPFFRLGLGGGIVRNDRFTFWSFQLPEGELGVHAGTKGVFVSVGALAGVTLGGRLLMGNEGRRPLGTAPHLGARATLGISKFVATATWRRIFEKQNLPESPVDTVEGALCVTLAKDVGFSVCADGRALRGDLGYPAGFRESTTFYGGISLSLGAAGTP